MKSFKQFSSENNYQYHIEEGIPLFENVFRVGSQAYFDLFTYARKQMEEGKYSPVGIDKFLLQETDIGRFDSYENVPVPLDCPMILQEEGEELDSPKRGGPKKYYVYTKNEKGNVVKVAFGQEGMRVKFTDEAARKSFVARHDCENKKDKTASGYWSCRLPYYAKQLGLSGGGEFFW